MPKIKISPSSLLLFAGIFLSENKLLALSLFICATIHEIGHFVAALLLKIKIKRFELTVCGAKIIPYAQICSYKDEFILCLLGPMANIITFFLFLPKINVSAAKGIISLDACTYIALFSIMLAIINLLPIKSLDGGRMLFLVISWAFGQRAGNLALNISTFLFALILWMLSVYLLILSRGGIIFFSFSLCMFLKIFEKST